MGHGDLLSVGLRAFCVDTLIFPHQAVPDKSLRLLKCQPIGEPSPKLPGFWALLITIGFVEILAFIASVPIGNARWQVNVVLSALYVVGIGLAGYSIFER